ncbi:putative protease precursor [Colletotrichum chrysophilum]|uniref:Protease n=1 Tax=Colletotrichum chrysophilum TaxID=1836956 RepID=A0AAD9EI66_9PEZI|nr:putative protease precursor [Colletotrichum chrysophilum]
MTPSVHAVTLFILSILNFGHAFAVPGVPGAGHSARIHERALTSWVMKGYGTESSCTQEQIDQIEPAVEYAKILAKAAMTALEDVGTSGVAYRRWFGDNNTNENTLASIKANNYEAVISGLRAPESGTVKSEDEGGPDKSRLVFSCPDSEHPVCEPNPYAGTEPIAGMLNAGEVYDNNVLRLCPPFFRQVSHSQMLVNWRDWKEGDLQTSAGFALLHEMQHLDAIVGKPNHCADHAYTVADCEKLSSVERLKNANTFALFALDVLVNPPSPTK